MSNTSVSIQSPQPPTLLEQRVSLLAVALFGAVVVALLAHASEPGVNDPHIAAVAAGALMLAELTIARGSPHLSTRQYARVVNRWVFDIWA